MLSFLKDYQFIISFSQESALTSQCKDQISLMRIQLQLLLFPYQYKSFLDYFDLAS